MQVESRLRFAAAKLQRFLSGLVTVFLLLPLPAFAFTFGGNWSLDSKSGDINWSEDGSHNLSFITSTSGSHTDSFTITLTNTVLISSSETFKGTATYNYTLNGGAYDDFSMQLKVHPTPYFTGNFSQSNGTANNQFTSDANRNYTITVTFAITANGGSWSSTPTTISNLTFQ